MVWFHVDENISFQFKTIEAGNCAMGLWLRAGAWCLAAKTDGYLPTHMALRMGTHQQLIRLVTSGFLEVADGGYIFHDWHKYQVSKENIESKRESDRRRKAEQRKRETVTAEVTRDIQCDSALSHNTPVTVGVTADSRARARSYSYSGSLSSDYLGGETNGEYGEPPPPRYCNKHMPDGTPDNCHACGAARKQFEAWEEHQRQLRAEHNTAIRTARDNCPHCDENGLLETPDGLTRCTHETGNR